jgi:hypothetical protein
LSKLESARADGCREIKLIIYFMETMHKPLYLDRFSLIEQNIMGVPTGFLQITVLLDEDFTCNGGVRFRVYVGKSGNHLCKFL